MWLFQILENFGYYPSAVRPRSVTLFLVDGWFPNWPELTAIRNTNCCSPSTDGSRIPCESCLKHFFHSDLSDCSSSGIFDSRPSRVFTYVPIDESAGKDGKGQVSNTIETGRQVNHTRIVDAKHVCDGKSRLIVLYYENNFLQPWQ